MPVISTADFKNGVTIQLDGEPYAIVEFQHVKPGKGGAFVRTKLRSVKTGNVFDRTFRAGERMELARVERRPVQFLYRSGEEFHFMSMADFEESTVPEALLGDSVQWMKENDEVVLVIYEDSVIGVDLPTTATLRVIRTEPGVRGDTATGGLKPATLETGAVVRVPLFINEGDTVKVDTRTGAYVERA